MYLTLYYWQTHQDPEGWKHDPYGLYSDLSEDNLGGEAEESLGEITGTPSKGTAAEKDFPKIARAAQP